MNQVHHVVHRPTPEQFDRTHSEQASTRAIIEHNKIHASTRAIGVHYILVTFTNARATIAHTIVHRHTPEQSECM